MPPTISQTVEAQDLRISQGKRQILCTHTLGFSAGEVWHLIGPNGAGKTSLLRALAGELPFQGTLTIAGCPPGTLPARRVTAFLPTDAPLLDDLTVAGNLSFMAAAWSRPLGPLLALAGQMGLDDWQGDWPVTLSRGTRQKVALAAGLGLGLPLTLLDEPFATLDIASRAVLTEAIRARASGGGTVIVTTHGAELLDVPHRRLEIVAGRLKTGTA
ncbi:ABC transporter domain-containing protein [Deinococcus saxicola]|uniref:ABC transporter ATP-binding protein n=1 Tax=Deinococcus saxicola TaxID=249406 RepID=UPI0039F00D31